jgi:hypothetical protein
MVLGPHHELVGLLRRAETDATSYVASLAVMEKLPALHQRRVLAILGAVTWPREGR